MIPKFNLGRIKKSIQKRRDESTSRYTSPPSPVPFLSNTVLTPEADAIALPIDFTVYIPLNMSPKVSRNVSRIRELQHQLAYGAVKIQGKKRAKKEISNQLNLLLSIATPGVPPLPKNLMHKFGFVAGVKRNSRTRIQPLDIPENWSMTVSSPDYLITGFSALTDQLTQYLIMNGGVSPGLEYMSRRPRTDWSIGGGVDLLPGRRMMLLKIVPQSGYITSAASGKNRTQILVEDLLGFIEMANRERRARLNSLDSEYADLSFFPFGVIVVPNLTSYGIHIPTLNRDTWHRINNVNESIVLRNPDNLPDEPQANNIDFASFARQWNKE